MSVIETKSCNINAFIAKALGFIAWFVTCSFLLVCLFVWLLVCLLHELLAVLHLLGIFLFYIFFYSIKLCCIVCLLQRINLSWSSCFFFCCCCRCCGLLTCGVIGFPSLQDFSFPLTHEKRQLPCDRYLNYTGVFFCCLFLLDSSVVMHE